MAKKLYHDGFLIKIEDDVYHSPMKEWVVMKIILFLKTCVKKAVQVLFQKLQNFLIPVRIASAI